MIYDSASDIVLDNVFVRLPGFVPRVDVLLKLEGLNPAGSIKLKTALALIESAESTGLLRPGRRVIESSSGNLGVALATVCAARGYPLSVVTDPNAARQAIRLMECLGAEVVEVNVRDPHGGYLHTRLDYIRRRLAEDAGLVWLNQYASPANVRVHRERTARAVHHELGDVDALFVGAGTTGTLMGCVEYFARHSPRTRVVGVDAVGSVTFGGLPGPRRIPGIGASRRPEIWADRDGLEKVQVSEADTIAVCRMVAARYGLLVGGSTGTVLSAVRRLAPVLAPGGTVVAVSPDLGDKYVDTVYCDAWVRDHYPETSDLTAAQPVSAP
ncbi:2,3-diaminopropionate biosynthesis protein SbnA [Streptomyces roseirectus]|uniref:2,3-diaminopropionate biosynthesis protein SbnA n=1 Tax=Streptomyces roseirectus TaxID=2768066 RepID=A0A7H0IQN0_9ACTN|nr:2,3-diaminopropionate biosynthesis protein SbnA [Streptomyces roseirectus]QNP75096.1 2,3-diaminopropionate biosynthesis protein SbnA [Streptomyces roseirectus]